MKTKYKHLATLLFAFAIVISTVSFAFTAEAVDLSRGCSLTVVPGSSDLTQELTEAGVVIDLYRVADAKEAGSSDSYTYSLLSKYDGLVISDNPNNSEWRSLSQAAAKIALIDGADTPVVTGAASDKAITQTDGNGNLSAGLYLVVARGQGVQNYTTTIKDESGNEQVATVAYSQKHVYTFAPELVSLPGKEADASGSVNTANPSEWIYDLSITLKPEQDVRIGSLEIIKTLLTYATGSPAIFVFSIEAVLNGENVYSDVISMDFNAPGKQRVIIDNIPVGAQVTVTEIYSGAGYSLDGSNETQTVVIPTGDTVSVSFTNNYHNGLNQGGGITNHFEYDDDSGWGWTQITAQEP